MHHLPTAQCLPDNVVAELDCNVNSFAVQWRASAVDVGSYTAIAIGSDGSRATCESPNTNCIIPDLQCGLNYSIVVTTPSVDCGTIEGSDYRMQSGSEKIPDSSFLIMNHCVSLIHPPLPPLPPPTALAACQPEGVLVDLQCGTDVASVTWENSGPDQTYVVSAMDGRGMTTTCNSSSANCTFDQLTCGESYAVSVVGHTDSCSSEPAFAETLNTGMRIITIEH